MTKIAMSQGLVKGNYWPACSDFDEKLWIILGEILHIIDSSLDKPHVLIRSEVTGVQKNPTSLCESYSNS